MSSQNIHSIFGPSYLFEGLEVYCLMQHFLNLFIAIRLLRDAISDLTEMPVAPTLFKINQSINQFISKQSGMAGYIRFRILFRVHQSAQ